MARLSWSSGPPEPRTCSARPCEPHDWACADDKNEPLSTRTMKIGRRRKPLLITECNDGIDVSGAAGGNPASDHGNEDKERGCNEKAGCVERADSEEQTTHAVTENGGNREAERYANGDHGQSPDKD